MTKKPIRADAEVAPEPFAGRGSVIEPVHAPGTAGRTVDRRENRNDLDIEDAEAAQEANDGASSGASRSVKSTNKRRKDRAA